MRYRLSIIVASLAFMLCGIGFQSYTTHFLHSAASETIIRSNDDYATLISNNYPATNGGFAVTNIKPIQKNWVIITVKNKTNNDTLRAVVNDPTNSTAGMRLILGPSETFSNYELSQHANIPTEIYKELHQ